MRRTAWIWALLGFAVTVFGGTVLHFVYDWLGGAVWVAPFSGVNESTWEHMKLLFWPMLAVAAVESRFFGGYPGFWCVKLRGILIGLSLIPVIFYTYNGAVGKSPDWLNITIFFVAAAAAFIYEARAMGKRGKRPCLKWLSLGAMLAIGALFVIFSFYPPHLGIFRDPANGTFGL